MTTGAPARGGPTVPGVSERKDRLIQTRVPESLESALKEEATRRRLPVSQLVRNILEDTLTIVDATSADGEALLNQARALLKPDSNGEGFQRRYHRAIQDVPDVLIAHVAVGKHLL